MGSSKRQKRFLSYERNNKNVQGGSRDEPHVLSNDSNSNSKHINLHNFNRLWNLRQNLR